MAVLTRRRALAATAGAALGLGAAVAIATPADAALIAQAEALRLLRARELTAWAALPDDHPDDLRSFVACGELADDVRAAGEALAEVAAVTTAGLAVKASAMLALFGPSSSMELEAVTEHHVLVASVLRDAARLGAGGAA